MEASVATASDESFTAQWQTEGEAVPPRGPGPDDDHRRRAWWVAAAVVLLVIGLSAAAWSVLGPDGSPDDDNRAASEHKNQSTGSSTSPSPSTRTDTTPPPTTSQTPDPSTMTSDTHSPEAAENFVSNYYTLVPGDIDAGWAQLSPGFQAATGRASYDEFWSSYSSVSVSDVNAVSPTIVDYTISYDGSSAEHKQITLVPTETSYLIDSDGQQG